MRWCFCVSHLQRVKLRFEQDITEGMSGVYLPYALAEKYPRAEHEWGWQWVFPSAKLSTDPRSGQVRRHHVPEVGLQRAVKEAVRLAGGGTYCRMQFGDTAD